MSDELDAEVDANFDAFRARLPELINAHQGQFALLRHREIEGYFGDLRSAFEAGVSRYSDRLFSVQEITALPADLGFFSHVVDTRLA